MRIAPMPVPFRHELVVEVEEGSEMEALDAKIDEINQADPGQKWVVKRQCDETVTNRLFKTIRLHALARKDGSVDTETWNNLLSAIDARLEEPE